MTTGPTRRHNQAIPAEAQIALKGNLRELERLADEITAFCRGNGLGDAVAFPLNLALEELFVNAVRHGGCEGMENAAEIRLQLAGHAVRVEFADRGRPFDPAPAPAPKLTAGLAEREDGGLGLHFVRQIMGDPEYYRDGQWNRVRMRLPLPDEKAEPI